MTSSSLQILVTTFADKKEASSVVRKLVEERVAACGTLFPKAHSIYRWQGELLENEEVVVWIKTSYALLKRCQERLLALHSYDTPELLVIEPSWVNLDYEKWVNEELLLGIR